MRKLWGTIILLTLFCLIIFTAKENQSSVAYNPKNLVRFHVIANSDLPEDQTIKGELRDVLLKEFGESLGQVTEKDELDKLLNDDLSKIETIAKDYLKTRGVEEKVKVEYGVFPFPVKGYGPLILPAGDYEALRVVIGEGQGSNWWCVLFPPLCFVNITEGVPDEESLAKILGSAKVTEKEAAPKQIKFKFKLLELFGKKDPPTADLFNVCLFSLKQVKWDCGTGKIAT